MSRSADAVKGCSMMSCGGRTYSREMGSLARWGRFAVAVVDVDHVVEGLAAIHPASATGAVRLGPERPIVDLDEELAVFAERSGHGFEVFPCHETQGVLALTREEFEPGTRVSHPAPGDLERAEV